LVAIAVYKLTIGLAKTYGMFADFGPHPSH